ncbi:MAG: hypothetical protein WCY62_10060, partial [Clostridia bacterium]
MRIVKVQNKNEMRDFVKLPSVIFKDHPCYIPPLWMDENKAYYAKNNPILANSDFELLLVMNDDNKPVGRAVVYIDHSYNAFYKSNIGFFGAFECIDDGTSAIMLIQACEKWLQQKGVHVMRGPINPVAENWGFVIEGYESAPVYMAPWNPPYYHDFFIDSGYDKVKDLLVYEADMMKGYELPKRYHSFTEEFMKRFPGISMRRLDMSNVKEDARSIWEISNIALADNWGYVPVDLPVMEDMLRKLK